MLSRLVNLFRRKPEPMTMTEMTETLQWAKDMMAEPGRTDEERAKLSLIITITTQNIKTRAEVDSDAQAYQAAQAERLA
jgi:hypothetical protein